MFDSGPAFKKLCDVAFVAVVKQLLQGYICIGGSVGAQLGPYKKGLVDYDLVWDLWNEQFSAFYYTHDAVSTETAAGLYGDVNLGFGFGQFPSVHEAWSGAFHDVEYEASVSFWKLFHVGGSVQGFSNPDRSMVGGKIALAASAGVPTAVKHLLKLPLHGSVTVGTGKWKPSDPMTRKLSGARSSDLKPGRGGLFLNLEEGEVGTAQHILQVMGATPLGLALAGVAFLVAATKRHAEDRGYTDRDKALQDLHLTLCNSAYRMISVYRGDVPSGNDERHYGETAVQRSARGNFVITSTTKTSTGEWRTVRRLHKPDATVVSGYRYWMAISGAPNGFIDGRSYPMAKFSDELGRRQTEMLKR